MSRNIRILQMVRNFRWRTSERTACTIWGLWYMRSMPIQLDWKVQRSAAAGSWQQPATTPRFVISWPIIWEACVSWRQTRTTCSNATTTILSENAGTLHRCQFRTIGTTSTVRRIKYSSETISRTTAPVVTTNLTGGGSRKIPCSNTIVRMFSAGIIRFVKLIHLEWMRIVFHLRI